MMKTRQRFVGGNWKMHRSLVDLEALTLALLKQPIDFKNVEVAVFPSFVYVPFVKTWLGSSKIGLGAQTLNENEKGAFTGEIAAYMLKDVGCQYVIVGHSERRQIYFENSERVANKFKQAIQQKLTPVLCVGETRAEREMGKTKLVIEEQLTAVLNLCPIENFQSAILAYEPVWAIGTGLSATPEQAEEMHVFMRQLVAQRSASIAESIRIIYGGSVKKENATTLFQMPNIDGGLIGGASLKADEFAAICRA